MSNSKGYFRITLTRWDSKKGERRMSASDHTLTDFAEAVFAANIMVSAAGEADPAREYKIAKVEQTGFSSTIDCGHGWLTDEEWFESLKSDSEE